jgi:tRNA-2-methylthio-N6-dimethylallyladenosine synthase
VERKEILIPEAEITRQREFTEKIRAMFAARGAHPRACVDTFGCQQNVADGQRLLGMLREMGFAFTDAPEEADVVLLNTCAVREHAEDRVFGNLGALTHTKKANPEQVICLCGCMAQEPRVSQRVKKSYPHVSLVFGPQALWKFPELLWQVYESRRRVFSVADEPGRLAEGCLWCGRTASGPGSPSCTGATTSAPTASCPTSGAGSGPGTRRTCWQRCGSW